MHIYVEGALENEFTIIQSNINGVMMVITLEDVCLRHERKTKLGLIIHF